ncbi:hypothetical protein CGCSCA4_v005810 [Colletotrichum siamense]|uniref:Uncharacterized protein n=1 Tax=Colletotrichum siamense TaxID=690259 RepID=A0A9P5EPK1_COLSI|nr:hypothetical protein CGCSCA4_v005810 [Colletotrichum siamense]KAF4856630.1 hypothetical protein CGCSCA2_v008476 [Colletotrichum siamense]
MPSPLTSPQAPRLLWRLQGPLAESSFVVRNWDTQDPPPGDDDCVYGELLDDLHYESECSSSEGDEEGDNGREGELLRCCDTDRPKQALPLVIEASNMEYISIHDYESALHPWLMGLRQEITRADNMLGDRKPEEYEHLEVDTTNPQNLSIMDEKRFLGYRYTGLPAQMPMSEEHAYLLSNVLTLDDPPFRNIPLLGGDTG